MGFPVNSVTVIKVFVRLLILYNRSLNYYIECRTSSFGIKWIPESIDVHFLSCAFVIVYFHERQWLLPIRWAEFSSSKKSKILEKYAQIIFCAGLIFIVRFCFNCISLACRISRIKHKISLDDTDSFFQSVSVCQHYFFLILLSNKQETWLRFVKYFLILS